MRRPSPEGNGYAQKLLRFLETDNGQRMAVCAFSIAATVVLVAFDGSMLAYIFGLPYIFFIPGFAVVRLFFWKGTTTEMRFMLSLGLSIVIVIILGLILVLTPIGLEPNTSRASLIAFAIGAVALDTFYPRKEKTHGPTKAPEPPAPRAKVDKVVAAMLAVAVVISGVSLGLIITAEYPSRTYFAMTGEDGEVIANITKLVNSSLVVNVEMMNDEDGPRDFMLVAYGVSTASERETQTFNRSLDKGELWTQKVVFWLNVTGYYRVDFDLYIQNDGEPQYLYGNLHLWFRVVAELEG